MTDVSDLDGGQPATAHRAEPVCPGERIVTLDVLRGIALWGILFVNVSATTQPADWFGVAWTEIGPLDYLTEVLKLFFVQGKFYTLFAFLFGLGFAVQLGRAEDKGQRFVWRFLWRMLLLWGIGFAHVIFLWDGDILNMYAVGGVLLLVFYGIKRLLDRLVQVGEQGPTGRIASALDPGWRVLADLPAAVAVRRHDVLRDGAAGRCRQRPGRAARSLSVSVRPPGT